MSHRPSSAIPSDFAAFALLLTALGLAACGAGTDAGGKLARDLSFPVELQTVTAESITFSIAAVGSVEAFEIVAVTARVGGAVEKMAFAEGDAAFAFIHTDAAEFSNIIGQDFQARDGVGASSGAEDQVTVGLVTVGFLGSRSHVDHALPDGAALAFERALEQ